MAVDCSPLATPAISMAVIGSMAPNSADISRMTSSAGRQRHRPEQPQRQQWLAGAGLAEQGEAPGDVERAGGTFVVIS
jgi:hypothetical protein